MKTMKSTIVMSAVLLVSGAVAQAQQDQPYFHAGWKMLGAQAFQGQQHAQDRAQQLYYYNQIPPTAAKSKNDAKDITAGIKKDLAAANKALESLRAEVAKNKEVEAAKNKEVVALVESITKHNAKAHEACGIAEEACMNHEGESPAVADCCSDMYDELEAAKADTTKLLKLLKIEKLERPTKAAPATK